MARRDHRDARGEQTLSCDVVIVGTGPGGAAAGRVIAESGRKVLFLEEGPATTRFRPNLAQVNRYHMQEGGVMVARSRDAMLPIAAGRGVGGGSLVNSASELLRRGKIDPPPPLIAGRRLWGQEHILQAAEQLGLATDELRDRLAGEGVAR